jgi:HAD superfamily hydrolase (TIGR01509 family)
VGLEPSWTGTTPHGGSHHVVRTLKSAAAVIILFMTRTCLVLDFDGTILDTEESLYRAWAELWADHGQQLSLVDWQQNIGSDDTFDPWAELELRLGRPLEPALRDLRRSRRDEIQAQHGPRPGITDWLAAAKHLGLPVGIASSSPIDWVEGHLSRLGLREQFSCIVCRDDEIPPKPSPISYLTVCQRLDAHPSRSIAVEDSPHGVAAAAAAGLFVVATPHGLTNDLDFSQADVVVASLRDLSLSDAMVKLRLRM